MTKHCDSTMDAFPFEPSELTAGSLTERHCALLIELTSIRAPKLSAALHSHLVDGLGKTEACIESGADNTSFSRKLSKLREVHSRVDEICAIYKKV